MTAGTYHRRARSHLLLSVGHGCPPRAASTGGTPGYLVGRVRTAPSLYLPCTFPVPSLYLPCTFHRWDACGQRVRGRASCTASSPPPPAAPPPPPSPPLPGPLIALASTHDPPPPPPLIGANASAASISPGAAAPRAVPPPKSWGETLIRLSVAGAAMGGLLFAGFYLRRGGSRRRAIERAAASTPGESATRYQSVEIVQA